MHKFGLTLLIVVMTLFLCFPSLNAEPQQKSDGAIETDEYAHTISFDNGNYVLYWTVADENISMAIQGKTTGWVGIGLKPTQMMKDADIILAGMRGEEVYWTDSYSTGVFGPHPDDTELGGTDDILNLSVSEQDGVTTLEFSRDLVTGDVYDAELSTGENVSIIWAMASDDDPKFKHNTSKGKGSLPL